MKLKRHIDFINENDNEERSRKSLSKYGMGPDLSRIKDKMEELGLENINLNWQQTDDQDIEVTGTFKQGKCETTYFYYFDTQEKDWIGGYENAKFPESTHEEMTVDEFIQQLESWVDYISQNDDCIDYDQD
jgi:hypothetical protein